MTSFCQLQGIASLNSILVRLADFSQKNESWLYDFDDISGTFPVNIPSYVLPQSGVSAAMQRATNMMRKNFQRRSRSASPIISEAGWIWYPILAET